MQWKTFIAIAIGGGAGSCLRYVLLEQMNTYSWWTPIIFVNIFGSLLLGILTGWFYIKGTKEWLRLGLGVGFCGGFTTMSTFAAEATQFALNGFLGFIYVGVTLFIGLAATGFGFWLGKVTGERRLQQ